MSATIALVKSFTDDVELGKVYEGVITRIEEYGAFVELWRGTTGLLHVSKISDERVENVNDYLHLGEKVRVIVTEIEQGGKFKLSMKPGDFDKDWTKERPSRPPRPRDDSRNGDRRGGDRGGRENHR